MTLFTYRHPSPVGELTAVMAGDALAYLGFSMPGERWLNRWFPGSNLSAARNGGLLDRLGTQLEEYFAKKRESFDLPLDLRCTDFQRRVYAALCEIPYGTTLSYGQLARKLDSGARAVGGANHNNPISVIIPCHRVIGADGSLTGYGGGLGQKRLLLELEKKGG